MTEITHEVPFSTVEAFFIASIDLSGSSASEIKLSEAGQLVCGRDNHPMATKRFVADLLRTERGFVCSVAGEIFDRVMAPIGSGTIVAEEDLADHGPYAEGDGWYPVVSVRLQSLDAGEEFVFNLTSDAGRREVGSVLEAFSRRLDEDNVSRPIIEIGAHGLPQNHNGTNFEPELNIVRWNDTTDLTLGNDPDEDTIDDFAPF